MTKVVQGLIAFGYESEIVMREFIGPFMLKSRTAAVLRFHEFRGYASDIWNGHPCSDRRNVLIYAQGRSGTTLLESLLISTGHFKGYHEPLNTVSREVFFPMQYIRGLGRMRFGRNSVVHVKPEHLGMERRKRGPVNARAFLETLIADQWTIVHIQRKDILRQMISKYIAQARGAYHKVDDAEEVVRILVPEAKFLSQYERRQSLLAEENAVLDGLPHLRFVYEEHLAQPEAHQRTVDLILTELGLEQRPISTEFRKIAKDSPSSFMTNYDALRSAFVARGWEWTL